MHHLTNRNKRNIGLYMHIVIVAVIHQQDPIPSNLTEMFRLLGNSLSVFLQKIFYIPIGFLMKIL